MENETKVARAVVATGIPTPAAEEILELNGQRGIVYERATGISMLQDMNTRPMYADSHLKFLVNGLKPFINSIYRTLPDQPNTFVMGSSMGGLISLYALTDYPQVFGGAGCFSTHWVADENLSVDYFASILSKPGAHKTYFYFGTGTLDATYESFQTLMDEKCAPPATTLGWTG